MLAQRGESCILGRALSKGEFSSFMSFFTRYSSFMCFNWYPSFGMECNWCHELCCIAFVYRLAFRGSRLCCSASPRAPNVCAPFSVELRLWFFSVGIEPASRVEPLCLYPEGLAVFAWYFQLVWSLQLVVLSRFAFVLRN